MMLSSPGADVDFLLRSRFLMSRGFTWLVSNCFFEGTGMCGNQFSLVMSIGELTAYFPGSSCWPFQE